MANALLLAEDVRLDLPDMNAPVLFGVRPLTRILRGVDFQVARGETVGIVGESGSGKTSLGRCLVRLHEPTDGIIRFDGSDITHVIEPVLRPIRRRMQMIFQDPQSSLNPRNKIGTILARPLKFYGIVRRREHIIQRVARLLGQVGLAPEFADRYPHELSGGQRQRVGIARAIALEPEFVVADEIVSGLDVSTQAQILDLLYDLNHKLGLAMAFISHDLSVIRHICDRVYVMRDGEVVEAGACDALFEAPKSQYTRDLIDAIPLPDPDPGWLDRQPSDAAIEDQRTEANAVRKPETPTKTNNEEKTKMSISGAIALVTGANRGVGKCFVEELARKGAKKIYAASRNVDNLTFTSFIGETEIVPLELDVTKEDQVSAARRRAGDVTLLVNNAGVNHMGRLMDASDTEAARTEMDTNYFGLLSMCRAFGPVIAANGGGNIVNMLSILGRVNLPAMGSLSASKAAAYNATQGIRAELMNKGVHVLAVLPGAIDTDMSKDFPGDKMPPGEVTKAALDALETKEWEIYPGDMANGLQEALSLDPLGVQQQMVESLETEEALSGKGEMMTVTAADGGTFQAYIAKPETGSGPGLVLLQEIFGINDYMQSMADYFAEEGYVAIVPDLFWRMEPGVNLGYEEEDMQKAFGFYQNFDVDQAIKDVQDTINTARGLDEVKGKVGAIGYCLGGLLAYLTAARTDVDVSVGYYAVGVEKYLDEADRIKCPLTLHFAEEDKFCPADARESIIKALEGQPDTALFTYAGQDHAFATPGRDHYDKPSTMMAYSRTLATLRKVLGPIYNLEQLWDMHCYHEFATRNVDDTMATMVDEPYVNHIPTMTGGVGHDHLKRFYKYHFVDSNPDDTKLIPISRTIGADRLVDEMIFCFTHSREIDWMLPGIAPTGKYVEVPLVAIVNFRGDKLYHEHIYWDQSSVLVQIGKLDPEGLPVAGSATAKKLIDETRPSNELMAGLWEKSEGKPI